MYGLALYLPSMGQPQGLPVPRWEIRLFFVTIQAPHLTLSPGEKELTPLSRSGRGAGGEGRGVRAFSFHNSYYFWHGSGQLYKFVGRFGKSSRGRFTKSPYKVLSTGCRLLNHALFFNPLMSPN